MAAILYYDVILKPVITEKSMAGMSEKKYTFLVHPEANKTMIKEAVEKMFEGTKVAKVNTMNIDGKKKRRGMTVGKTAKTKKAIVWLTEDSKEKKRAEFVCKFAGRIYGYRKPAESSLASSQNDLAGNENHKGSEENMHT